MMDPASWEKVKDVITDALKRSPAEREAFVREQCPDPALRAEVDALLRHYEETADFLEQPPQVDGPDGPSGLQPGTQVGPYVIVHRLGYGGMGEVFLGSDPRLHRKVALKCLISSRLSDDDRRPRILNEARAAARINHPNVATVHDVIEHESRIFIVMEYVEGESLLARMKRERLPIDYVLAIGRQLASALAAAHATGIIHGDLKPANIHLTPAGSVKVLDFGLAKVVAALSTTEVRKTTAAHVGTRADQGGTPGYMSPEQLLGREIDERSDIFSFGVILFEMTAGRRLFTTTDPLDLVVALAKEPPRADMDDPRVPRELADVITKALELDLAARFQSAVAVGTALEAIESNRATIQRPRTVAVGHELKTWPVARVIVMVLLVPVVLGCLGFITTAGFNITFGRAGAFGRESLTTYIDWGYRSVVAPVFWGTATMLVMSTVKFAFRLLAVSERINRALARAAARARRIESRLGLNDPVVLAQALAALGALSVAAVLWRYYDLIRAWSSYVTTSAPELLLPLNPDNPDRSWYRVVLAVLTFIFGFSSFHVIQRRRRQNIHRSAGALIVLGAIIVVMVMLNELPYRIFRQDSERINFAGLRCYEIGEHDDELLIYCPDTFPPRNRVVKRNDPLLRKVGIVESVFTPAPSSRTGS